MSEATRPLRHERPAQDLIARLPGWRAVGGAPTTLALGGTVYSVALFARRRGRVALSCEPPPGTPLPGHAQRTRLYALLETLHSRPLAVFTDAARSAEVWCWTNRASDGAVAYHERFRGQGRGDVPTLEDLADCGLAGRSMRPGAKDSVAAAISLALLALLPSARRLEAGAAGEDPSALFRRALCDPGGPAATRAAWRGLLRLRVLDPACGSGDWLVEARDALAALYVACLEQMSLWVGEAVLGCGRRRPEYLRDFRGVLARVGHGAARRDAFVRETILLHNLHGAARDAGAAAACRRRLCARRGSPFAALPAGFCRVRAGDPRHGFATRAAVARALVGDPHAGRALREIREGAEVLAAADDLLRAQRLAGSVDASGLAAALAIVDGRRDALRRRLDAAAFRAGGGDPRDARALRSWSALHRPLHPYLEWGGAARGVFHLVRGAAR